MNAAARALREPSERERLFDETTDIAEGAPPTPSEGEEVPATPGYEMLAGMPCATCSFRDIIQGMLTEGVGCGPASDGVRLAPGPSAPKVAPLHATEDVVLAVFPEAQGSAAFGSSRADIQIPTAPEPSDEAVAEQLDTHYGWRSLDSEPGCYPDPVNVVRAVDAARERARGK